MSTTDGPNRSTAVARTATSGVVVAVVVLTLGLVGPWTVRPAAAQTTTTTTHTGSSSTGVRTLTPEQLAELRRLQGDAGARMGGPAVSDPSASPRAGAAASATATPTASTWRPPGVQGVDVSSWNGTVDWAAQSRMGAMFAYVKATEGTTYKSPTWSAQYNGAGQHGVLRGSYHFALPPVTPAAEQARFFVANGGGWSADGKTLPPLLDIEFNPYEPKLGNMCYSMTPEQLTNWIREFVVTVESLVGRRPAIYTNTHWWNTCVKSADFGAYPLHIARYGQASGPGALPVGWSKYHIWQYSSTGPFAGDSNVWNGSYSDLVAWARLRPSTDPNGPAATRLPRNLYAGQSVVTPNGKFRLTMQGDGNAVVYDVMGRPVWETRTYLPGGSLAAQGDGNLVLYQPDWRPRWYTATSAPGGSIVLQDDGNIVIRNANGFAQWDSLGLTGAVETRVATRVSTLASGQTAWSLWNGNRLVMQGDGNLVLYRQDNSVVWQSGTYGQYGATAALQPDGNLVLTTADGQAMWHSVTYQYPGATLELQDDANLVLHDPGRTPRWDAVGAITNRGERLERVVAALEPTQSVTALWSGMRVAMQYDGNLVVYRPDGGVAWHAGTVVVASRLVMQADGNLVMYAPDGRALWHTNTYAWPGSTLRFGSDGNLVIYDQAGVARWDSMGYTGHAAVYL